MRWSTPLWLDTWIQQTTPLASTLALLLVGVVPSPIPLIPWAAPLLSLIAIYHWGLHRPDRMPAWTAFAIGLIHDILSGAPVGVTAAVFVLTQGVAESQRRFFLGKPFRLVWLGFALVAATGFGLSWLLTSAFYAQWIGARPLAVQALLTVACFPVASGILLRCRVTLPKQAGREPGR